MKTRNVPRPTSKPKVQQCVNIAWVGEEIILLRREEGRLVTERKPAPYVCYLPGDQVGAETEQNLRRSRYVKGYQHEGDWVRIEWHTRSALRTATSRDGWFPNQSIDTYEADLNPVRRYIVDNDIRVQRPRRCYLDIETDSRVPISKKEQARILCWSIVDEEGECIAGVLEEDTDAAEVTLLEDLFDELMAYDQVIGWYLDGFDRPVIQARARKHDVRVEMRRWLWLDQLDLYKRFNMAAAESGDEKTSMALNAVAHALLGEGKHDVDASKSWELWVEGGDERQRLVDYCVQDTALLPRIEEKTGFVELLFTLCETTSTFPDSRGINPTNFVEGFLLKLARERGMHFRTHWDYTITEQFAGAFVMDPTKEMIMKNVHVADFASLYPSIIQTWNISPETWLPNVRVDNSDEPKPSYLSHMPHKEYELPDGTCKTPLTKKVFGVETPGLLPLALDELKHLRAVWNEKKAKCAPGTKAWKDADRRSTAYKIAANSFYGVIGSPFSRFFQREAAEAVTQCGVWLIKETIHAAEERGWEVVYADTDSLFAIGCTREQFGKFVEWCNVELYPDVIKAMGCVRNEIKLAYEKEFALLVMVSAKRYAGKFAHYKGKEAEADSEPEVKGLEYKRGDTARLARRMQKEVIDLLMSGEEDTDVYLKLVEEWKERVVEGELDAEDFVMSKRLSKPLRSYTRKIKKDGTPSKQPPHVEVARKLAALGQDVREGVRIQYVVIDGKDTLEVIPRSEYKKGDEDRYYLWERLVYPATQRLLEAAFNGSQWREHKRVRPRKVQPCPRSESGRKLNRGRLVPEGQTDMF